MRFAIIGAGMAGHPQRDQAQRGRPHRLHGVREGRSARRHLAREHLSRASRATCPSHLYSYSFALDARLEPPLLARAARSVATSSASRASTTSIERVRFGDEVTSCTFADGRWHLETAGRPPRRGRRRDRRHRRAPPPAAIPTSRASTRSRARCSTAPAGTTASRSTARASASSAPARPRCRSCRPIVDRVAKLTLFQRTAQWIMPQENPAYTDEEKAELPRRPGPPARRCTTQLAEMFGLFANAVIDAESPEIKMIEDACLANLENNVHDPELRERLRPDVPRRVQAPDHLARLLRRDPAAQRRARDRGHRAHRAERRAHRRRRAPRARRARARDRLQGRRVHAADAGRRAATGTRSTRCGRERPNAYLSISIPELPELLHAQRPERSGRQLLAHRGRRAPVRLHHAARRAAPRRASAARSARAREAMDAASKPRAPRPRRRRSGSPAAAAGTSTTAASRRRGRGRSTASARRCASPTSRASTVARGSRAGGATAWRRTPTAAVGNT